MVEDTPKDKILEFLEAMVEERDSPVLKSQESLVFKGISVLYNGLSMILLTEIIKSKDTIIPRKNVLVTVFIVLKLRISFLIQITILLELLDVIS
jgi:hypothetical protein